jgi:uncharacterized membrane protein
VTSFDVPLDLYIAAYLDDAQAQNDWDVLKQLDHDKVVRIDGMALVSRDPEGKIHIKDTAVKQEAGIGAAAGGVVGAVIGLIFPPALLASAVVGAGIGAAGGVVIDQVTRHQIKADVENMLPPDSSAIVAIFEERWVEEVEKALAKAENLERHHVHEAPPDATPSEAANS